MFYVLTKWKGDQEFGRRSTVYKYAGKAIRVAKDLFDRNHYDEIKVVDENQTEVYMESKE